MSGNKTVIVYASYHHKNTEKLVKNLAQKYGMDTADILKDPSFDASAFDVIGIASGVAYGKYYPQMLHYLEAKLPADKEVFYMHTAGSPASKYRDAAKAIADSRNCKDLGVFCCKGFDTFGPLKLIGGIRRNHPDEADLQAAGRFFEAKVLNK